MKRLIMFILAGFSLLCVFPASVTLTPNRIVVEDGNSKYMVSPFSVAFTGPIFSFGAVDEGGDMALLMDFHGGHNEGLSFSLPSSGTSLLASSVTLGSFDFSLLSGDREGLGLGYGWDGGRVFSYGFLGGKDDSLQKESLGRTDFHVIYLGAELKSRNISLMALTSLTETLDMRGAFLCGADLGKISFSFSYGRVQDLLGKGKDWNTSVSLGIGEEKAEASFTLKLGKDPIYSPSFRSLHFSSRGRLKVGKLDLEAKVERSFIEGREKGDWSISLSGEWWKLKYSGDKGLSLSLSFGLSSVSFSKEEILTKLTMEGEKTKVTFSSEKNSQWKVEMDV